MITGCFKDMIEDLALLLAYSTAVKPRHLLAKSRVRAGGAQANLIHISTLWTLGIPKLYMRTVDYKGKFFH